MSQKQCSKCRAFKPVEEFYKNRAQPDGLDNQCNVCGRITRAKHKSDNPEQGRKSCKKWAANCDRKALQAKNHRLYLQRKAMGPKTLDPLVWAKMLVAWDGKCAYCGKPAECMDHFISVSKGGETTPFNIVPCCKWCNASKRDREPLDWMRSKGFDAEAIVNRKNTIASSLEGT